MIDELPAGGPPWNVAEIVLPDAPNEPQLLFYRDPVECLKFLQANPAFKDHTSFVPVQKFQDKAQTVRCIVG